MVAATIEKSKAALTARLGTTDLVFRVVVEDGKPKIKASQRK
jgi:Ethanolamine utilization protein EutJ (predicted chaperonin)